MVLFNATATHIKKYTHYIFQTRICKKDQICQEQKLLEQLLTNNDIWRVKKERLTQLKRWGYVAQVC